MVGKGIDTNVSLVNEPDFLFLVSVTFQRLGRTVLCAPVALNLLKKNQASTVVADIEPTVGDFNIDTLCCRRNSF